MKRIVSISYFNENIAGKDMFLVNKYLGNELGEEYEIEIVYPRWNENAHFGEYYRDVRLTSIKSGSKFYSTLWSEKEMLWWLIKNARSICILSLFWLNPRNMVFARIYKILNPSGICYIKGDMGDVHNDASKGFKNLAKNFFYKAIDILSVETVNVYNKIKDGALGEHMAKSVVLMSNGFDIDLFDSYDIDLLEFKKKKNQIITVARIGSPEKNNEMMLDVLTNLDLKDWKMIFVGPVEDSFYEKFERFRKDNPDKIDNVVLYGAEYDRNKLWNIYNQSKIFLLTSTKEGMANVYSEAIAFGNYIITTPVSASLEITDNGRIGMIIDYDDINAIKERIQDVIDGRYDIKHQYEQAMKLSSEKYNWRTQIRVVANKIREIMV